MPQVFRNQGWCAIAGAVLIGVALGGWFLEEHMTARWGMGLIGLTLLLAAFVKWGELENRPRSHVD